MLLTDHPGPCVVTRRSYQTGGEIVGYLVSFAFCGGGDKEKAEK